MKVFLIPSVVWERKKCLGVIIKPFTNIFKCQFIFFNLIYVIFIGLKIFTFIYS